MYGRPLNTIFDTEYCHTPRLSGLKPMLEMAISYLEFDITQGNSTS